jgi:low density lipoprotein receptor-related protein 5/6
VALVAQAAGAVGPEYAEILRADPDGTGLEQVLSAETALASRPLALDPDPGSARIFWLTYLDPLLSGTIRSASVEGDDVQDVVGGDGPIAVDSANQRIYFALQADCEPCAEILRADFDGSDLESLVQETAVGSIAVDSGSGKMYWYGLGWIRWANLDGTQEQQLIPAEFTSSMAIDVQAGKLYWVETQTPGGSEIRRADLDGSDVEDLVTGLTDPYGLAIDPAGDRMWWTDFALGTVHRSRLDGTEVTEVLSGLDRPVGIGYLPLNDKIYMIANPRELDVPATSLPGLLVLAAVVLAASAALVARRRRTAPVRSQPREKAR